MLRTCFTNKSVVICLRVENEDPLEQLEYFELSLLQSHGNKQFCLINLSIAKNIEQYHTVYRISIDRMVPQQLKDKSGLDITVDYSRDYTVVNGV